LLLALVPAIGCGDEPVLVIGPPSATPADAGPAEAGPGLPPVAILAVDWGQDLFGGTNPDMSLREKPLADVCAPGTPYDFVLIDYVTQVALGSDGSQASFAQNFANHCTPGTALAGAPGLAQCDDIAAGIAACHQSNKKVLITVGGPTDPGLATDMTGSVGAQAAQSMWDLYLGGNGPLRPFAGQTVDGVNVEASFASSPGSVQFVAHLRQLMNGSGNPYYLTATPQCDFPDPLGPGMGKVIDENAVALDALFVEFFFDTDCLYSASNPAGFVQKLQSWATLLRDGRPKIVVGLRLEPTQAGYVDRPSLPMLVRTAAASAAFGGLLLRDESYDQNSTDSSGMTYGSYAKSLLP
jgi:chitinase